MKKIKLAFITLCMAQLSFAQTIDVEKSEVSFEISNMKWKTVEGTFKGMTGEVIFDKNNLNNSSFNVSINPSSINTENKTRDKHLKNKDFFEVSTYTTINFKSKSIAKTASGYITKGTLTMHGISKEIEIPFVYENNQLKGTFNLNRLDFGIGPKGGFMSGKEVIITILCVLK